MRFRAVVLSALALLACAEERPRAMTRSSAGLDAGGASDAGGGAPGLETLGAMCFGACGSADQRKCSIGSPDCQSDLCLVDPGHPRLAYCTIDCTRSPCPSGWRCEAIKAFGHDEVERGCVAEPAMCGDGVVQLGESCDGDDPARGRCVGCERFEPVCGDGRLQPGEVCDGPADGKYCTSDCSRLVPPRFKLTVRKRVANAVDVVEGNTTRFYGTGFTFGEVHEGELPAAGDANGCGAVRVLASDAELTRLEWTHCGDSGARSRWIFAVPRNRVSYRDFEGPLPAQFDGEVTLRHPDGVRTLYWSTPERQAFEVRSYLVMPPGQTTGDVKFRWEQPDPIQSFSVARAELELGVELLHPALPQ